MTDEDVFSDLSNDDLVKLHIEGVQTFHAMEHVGAKNRYAAHQNRIRQALKARDETLAMLRPLLDHSDPVVRHSTAIEFRTIDHATSKRVLSELAQRTDQIGREAQSSLRWDEYFQEVGYPELQKKQPLLRTIPPEFRWQVDHLPSPAPDSGHIIQRLRDTLPATAADHFVELMRPAIGLWPQRRNPDSPLCVSRLGGLPDALPGWSWPMLDAEPYLFIGQINCAAVHGIPGAERLPTSGILSFFGDHDAVMGCSFGSDDIAVYHWTDVDRLRPAKPPIESAITLPECELLFRSIIDLPDPSSAIVEDALKDREQIARYKSLLDEVRYHGIPTHVRSYSSFGKLFGWPALVQGELDHMRFEPDLRLLLQLDDYSNGDNTHGWASGGSLYFLMHPKDLTKRRFDQCRFEIQFT